MDAAQAFEVALDHYRKGEHLLNWPEAVPMDEQALHFARAGAHFAAGNLVLSLAKAEAELPDRPADDEPEPAGTAG